MDVTETHPRQAAPKEVLAHQSIIWIIFKELANKNIQLDIKGLINN